MKQSLHGEQPYKYSLKWYIDEAPELTRQYQSRPLGSGAFKQYLIDAVAAYEHYKKHGAVGDAEYFRRICERIQRLEQMIMTGNVVGAQKETQKISQTLTDDVIGFEKDYFDEF